ncbi:MAG: hypothetical protein E7032_03650 [Akkermansiaceae bacterium]|nr:hypothetical protein [Akkermansiaceae bacterium]
MSEIRIEGADSVPAQPMLVLPNRVDLPTMLELEKALGGPGRVAWMVENTLMPGEAIMNHLRETRSPALSARSTSRGAMQ